VIEKLGDWAIEKPSRREFELASCVVINRSIAKSLNRKIDPPFA